jgi:hypothetical protein
METIFDKSVDSNRKPIMSWAATQGVVYKEEAARSRANQITPRRWCCYSAPQALSINSQIGGEYEKIIRLIGRFLSDISCGHRPRRGHA